MASNGPDGRTWRNYFPEGDLWVFGYGYVKDGLCWNKANLTQEFDLEASATLWYPGPVPA
jgi:hypothetical protein